MAKHSQLQAFESGGDSESRWPDTVRYRHLSRGEGTQKAMKNGPICKKARDSGLCRSESQLEVTPWAAEFRILSF